MQHDYPKAHAKPYVLLAENDEDDCMFFKEAFNEINLNLHLFIVHNGIELMNYLSETMRLLPQLLFLDLNMPLKNGFECLHELKENKRLKDIPVIVYSTSNSSDDYEKCRQLKAHLYISKPNSFIKLKEVIQKVLVTDFVSHLTEEPKEHFLVFSED
ncbi:MAG: response regulator [Bacteroidia bacterium]